MRRGAFVRREDDALHRLVPTFYDAY